MKKYIVSWIKSFDYDPRDGPSNVKTVTKVFKTKREAFKYANKVKAKVMLEPVSVSLKKDNTLLDVWSFRRKDGKYYND